MFNLIIAAILFVTQLNQEPKNVEYKIVTTVETINFYGWSGIVAQNGKLTQEVNAQYLPENYIFKSKGKEEIITKVDSLKFTPLWTLNVGGSLSHQNLAKNDVVMTTEINDLISDGWELAHVTSGVGSAEGGIFITKYYFKREF